MPVSQGAACGQTRLLLGWLSWGRQAPRQGLGPSRVEPLLPLCAQMATGLGGPPGPQTGRLPFHVRGLLGPGSCLCQVHTEGPGAGSSCELVCTKGEEGCSGDHPILLRVRQQEDAASGVSGVWTQSKYCADLDLRHVGVHLCAARDFVGWRGFFGRHHIDCGRRPAPHGGTQGGRRPLVPAHPHSHPARFCPQGSPGARVQMENVVPEPQARRLLSAQCHLRGVAGAESQVATARPPVHRGASLCGLGPSMSLANAQDNHLSLLPQARPWEGVMWGAGRGARPFHQASQSPTTTSRPGESRTEVRRETKALRGVTTGTLPRGLWPVSKAQGGPALHWPGLHLEPGAGTGPEGPGPPSH